jgi:hypothetical protein
VVLAHAAELDIADEQDFVVDLRKGDFEMAGWVDMEAREHLSVHLGDAPGGFDEPGAIRVFADGFQDGANGVFDGGQVHVVRLSKVQERRKALILRRERWYD